MLDITLNLALVSLATACCCEQLSCIFFIMLLCSHLHILPPITCVI